MQVIFSSSEPPVFVSAIYASPNASLRRFIWSQLIALDPGSDNAWILGGDFNAIYDPEDRLGGARSRLGTSRGMADFVFEAGLSAVKFRGPRFTWKRVLNVEKPFRFVFAWQEHSSFKDVLARVWDRNKPVFDNLQHCQQVLSHWNEHTFGHIGQRKRRILARLKGIDNFLASKNSRYLTTLELTLKAELYEVLEQEESLWIQKSRCKWIRDGDRNTKYFHACARSRKRANTVMALRSNEGDWCVDQEGLQQLACSYFKSLFTSDGIHDRDYFVRNSYLCLADSSLHELGTREPNYFPKANADWDIMFGSLLWLLWKRRNDLVFNPTFCGLDNTLHQGQRLLQESLRARSPVRVGRMFAPWQSGLNVRWCGPPISWLKVNTDGARSIRSGLATCGGVGRDASGNWCFGFSRALGVCSTLEAELWGVYEGLTTAWSLGFPRVIVEMDCRDAYEMVALGNPKQLGSSLTAGLLEMHHRPWEIKFSFIKREGNVPADLMARLAWKGYPEYRRYMEPPSTVLEAFQFDRDLVPDAMT
ncbi:hypothetical protein GQ457_05G009200 [Hibiscus cannabinus]